MFPDDCIQSIVSTDPAKWWVPNEARALTRGALIVSFVPHVDQVPYTFEPVGRTVATEHKHAEVRVTPLKVDQPLKQTDLPVSAMPLHGNEVWAAFRAKKRPCLVLAERGPTVDAALTKGMPKYSSAPTMLVAPYYGASQGGRAGFNPVFVERIRHCVYPQFVWDLLPGDGGQASILRLDQMQPIGSHHHSYKVCSHRLSSEALSILDALVHWVVWGGVPDGHELLAYRELIRESFGH